MHQSLIGASLILNLRSKIFNMLFYRTASRQRTLPTVRVFQAIRTTTLLHTGGAKRFYHHAPNPYIVIVGFFVQKIKVYPDNVIVCSGVGTSITTGRTEFGPTHAGSLPNSEYFVFPFSFSFRLQKYLGRFHFCFPSFSISLPLCHCH